eukprot:gene270-355_t
MSIELLSLSIHQLTHQLRIAHKAYLPIYILPPSLKSMRIGVIMGGFSAERHISVESGRNVYEKLASSGIYTPIPIFLTGSPDQHALFILPIHILLKDSADDIHAKLQQFTLGSATPPPQEKDQVITTITQKYAGSFIKQPIPLTYQELSQWVDSVFLALHGRPGEDGTLQSILESQGLPYNGSGIEAASLAINKFATNAFLRQQGAKVANHALITKKQWQHALTETITTIEKNFQYPFIVKPVDDGCSVAVLKIKHRDMLVAYAAHIFREDAPLASSLGTPPALFPQYQQFLIEDLIEQGDALHFLEITGGFLTHFDAKGNRQYEMFEPSEVIAQGDILSLEEKFLAGEGQNITPARFHPDPKRNTEISSQVKQDLQKVAQLVNLEGYARIDAMVKVYAHHIETWIVEINTLPALTPATCIFHQCANNGYKPFDFLHTIIQYGHQRS